MELATDVEGKVFTNANGEMLIIDKGKLEVSFLQAFFIYTKFLETNTQLWIDQTQLELVSDGASAASAGGNFCNG